MSHLLACPTSHPFFRKGNQAGRVGACYPRAHRECRQRNTGPWDSPASPVPTSLMFWRLEELRDQRRLLAGLGLARTLDSSAELHRPCAPMVPRCAGHL